WWRGRGDAAVLTQAPGGRGRRAAGMTVPQRTSTTGHPAPRRAQAAAGGGNWAMPKRARSGTSPPRLMAIIGFFGGVDAARLRPETPPHSRSVRNRLETEDGGVCAGVMVKLHGHVLRILVALDVRKRSGS